MRNMLTIIVSLWCLFAGIKGQCGVDCSGCNNNEATCNAAGSGCFYLVDTGDCRIKFDCASNCRLCSDSQTQCENDGPPGLCLWLGNGLCVGQTCDTECEECAASTDPIPEIACKNSSAPYTGCVLGPGELCEFNTRNPTMDPTIDPTIDPTTDPTIDPTMDPSMDPTNDPSMDPTQDPTDDPTQDPSIDPTNDPTQQPTTDEPTTDSPTTNEPTTDSPTTNEPTTDNPTTDNPTTDSPTTDNPTTDNPTTDNPTTDSPTTDNPTTDNPTTGMPTTTTALPTTAMPTTDEPTTDSPTTFAPTTDNPTTDEPTTDSPTTAEPTRPVGECPDCPYNISIVKIGNVTVEECVTDPPTPQPTGYNKKDYWNKRTGYNKKGKKKSWDRRRLAEVEEEYSYGSRVEGDRQVRTRTRRRDRRRLWGGYSNKKKTWSDDKKKSNKKYNKSNKKYKTPSPTPQPTPWIKDRVCIEDNGDDDRRRRRLWGYRSRDKDGCGDDDEHATPAPTEPDPFTEWYKEKCPSVVEDGYDDGYNTNGYGSNKKSSSKKSSKKSSSKSSSKEYGFSSSKYTSWVKRKDESDEFITEVCVKYRLNQLEETDEDCPEVSSIFLSLCENNRTDFNSSTLDENDLTGLIVSLNGDDLATVLGGNDDGIVGIGGAIQNDQLGILIEFDTDDDQEIDEFELCLGNVTVDSDFNDERDMIELGDGTVNIGDDECPGEGLPCLNFFFDVPCPPETTDDGRDCTCTQGISTITVQYDGDTDADISVYVDKKDDDPLCEFTNVAPGDQLTCSSDSVFDDKTYFVINYDSRRRLGGYSKYLDGDCIGKFKTNCYAQIVGTTAYNCDDISAVSYVDGAGQYCDADVLAEDGTGYDNALINGELRLETPLQVLEDMDPMVRWSLIGILITFLILLFVACYICIVRRNNEEEEKKTPKSIAKSIALSTQTRLKNRVSQEDGEVVDKDEDYYVEDEEDKEFCETKKKPESPGPSFYDDDDLDNMVEMAVKQQEKERNQDEDSDEYYDEEQYVE